MTREELLQAAKDAQLAFWAAVNELEDEFEAYDDQFADIEDWSTVDVEQLETIMEDYNDV